MKEWNDPFNPFNSMKVLMWRRHLEHCAKRDFLTPVTVDVDPSNKCNFDCVFCNAYDMMNQPGETKIMPEDHLLRLADFLADWGKDTIEGNPKSACVAGGGEPLTNPGTMAFLERMHLNNLECGLITNGSLLNDEMIEIVAKTCRWVGFSMDAASPATYSKIKGIKNEKIFNKVIENIRKLTRKIVDTGAVNDVSYKYLVHPWNALEIYDAAKLAKEIGVRDFHLRPVGWINLTKTKNKERLNFKPLLKLIDDQIEKALELEDSRFHFYGVRHKFTEDMSPKKNFRKCWTIPLLPCFGADGWVHTCFDMRGKKELRMCQHYPDPYELERFWNTEEHRKLVDSIDVQKCPRCTFTVYNEAVEKAVIEDRMCYKFP